MDANLAFAPTGLLDEHRSQNFRRLFGQFLRKSVTLDTAILRIRLGAVDLSAKEVAKLRRMRVLVAELSARTLEEEAYALLVDPEKRHNLDRITALLRQGTLEIRSAPLGGWSPDFSVFGGEDGPFAVLVGLHWFQKPFPHRGPAWAAWFGKGEALLAAHRYSLVWKEAHDIGHAVQKLLDRTARRWDADRTRHPERAAPSGPASVGAHDQESSALGKVLPDKKIALEDVT